MAPWKGCQKARLIGLASAALWHPVQGAGFGGISSGGIASLNHRLISDKPAGLFSLKSQFDGRQRRTFGPFARRFQSVFPVAAEVTRL